MKIEEVKLKLKDLVPNCKIIDEHYEKAIDKYRFLVENESGTKESIYFHTHGDLWMHIK